MYQQGLKLAMNSQSQNARYWSLNITIEVHHTFTKYISHREQLFVDFCHQKSLYGE